MDQEFEFLIVALNDNGKALSKAMQFGWRRSGMAHNSEGIPVAVLKRLVITRDAYEAELKRLRGQNNDLQAMLASSQKLLTARQPALEQTTNLQSETAPPEPGDEIAAATRNRMAIRNAVRELSEAFRKRPPAEGKTLKEVVANVIEQHRAVMSQRDELRARGEADRMMLAAIRERLRGEWQFPAEVTAFTLADNAAASLIHLQKQLTDAWNENEALRALPLLEWQTHREAEPIAGQQYLVEYAGGWRRGEWMDYGDKFYWRIDGGPSHTRKSCVTRFVLLPPIGALDPERIGGEVGATEAELDEMLRVAKAAIDGLDTDTMSRCVACGHKRRTPEGCVVWDSGHGYRGMCAFCGANTGDCESVEAAVEAWNKMNVAALPADASGTINRCKKCHRRSAQTFFLNGQWRVRCEDNCLGTTVGWYDTETEAIVAWNEQNPEESAEASAAWNRDNPKAVQ